MKFREKWKKLDYWKRGGIIGIIVGLVKIPFFILFGGNIPEVIGNLFSKLPDEALCSIFNFELGEPCGFFVLIYGFIYNPIFYGAIGVIFGLLYSKLKRK